MKHNIPSKSFLLAGLILAICGCGPKEDKSPPANTEVSAPISSEIILPELASENGDTINLYGRFILFYGPAAHDSADAGQPAYFSLSRALIDSISNNSDIAAFYSSANHIRVYNKTTGTSMIILRSTFNVPQGVVMSDGLQAPIIKKGILERSEYDAMLRKYFMIPM